MSLLCARGQNTGPDQIWNARNLVNLTLLVIIRAFLQGTLYSSGFEALTADDFGRVVLAANWSLEPSFIWNSFWLPFHTYIHGIALKIHWDLVWTPRVLTMLFGLTTIVFIYLIAASLFQDRRAGIISAILLAINPAHNWLSSTPLTEIPYTAFVLSFLWGLIQFFKTNQSEDGRSGPAKTNQSRTRYLLWSAISLALANGFRFEGWVITGLFSLAISLQMVKWIGQTGSIRTALPFLFALGIAWLFPALWMGADFLQTGDPLASIAQVQAYKARWYSNVADLLVYPLFFFRLDPYAALLAPVAFLLVLRKGRKSNTTLWYTILCVIPVLVFIYIAHGQTEPSANYIRYLAPFLFTVYPAVSFILVNAFDRIPIYPIFRSIPLIGLIGLMIFTQLRATFQYLNDPASEGLQVGYKIQEIRRTNPHLFHKTVMLELSYWQYLAVHVGANDVQAIIYDRKPDYDNRRAPSLLATDLDAARSCLTIYDVGLLVLKSPDLKEIAEQELALQPSNTVNSYTFYFLPLSETVIDSGRGACPLK